MTLDEILRRAPIKGSELARKLGITHGAVCQWGEVPANRVLDVERLTGIPRHEIRPDLYPPEREVQRA